MKQMRHTKSISIGELKSRPWFELKETVHAVGNLNPKPKGTSDFLFYFYFLCFLFEFNLYIQII